ncbi:MAG TPA: CoA transferase, partial [Pseudomonadales bacterium]|nr:CoA transferase [Pseudomonadales bacterium]
MTNSINQLSQLWRDSGLDEEALNYIETPEQVPVFATSFHVGVAAQTSISAAALAAAEIWFKRTGARQHVSVDMNAAELECTGYFSIDDRVPDAWAKFSGLYPCRDGHVRIHANFEHHRDGILNLLGLPEADKTEKNDVEKALQSWQGEDFETAAAAHGLVASFSRSFEQWDIHPQAQMLNSEPLISIEKVAESAPLPLPAITTGEQPLTHIKVLDLTRILAGPICGRTLAAYGADVMLINAPQLPNIDSIIDTSRGKLSAHVDLRSENGIAALRTLAQQSDVFVQGYRPGGLDDLGFGAHDLCRRVPGLVYVSLSAYGHRGPWSSRRGFDSLVQTATGFNHAEAAAFGAAGPKAMPVQILDYASGFLMAFAAQVALLKRAEQGGSWHVRISLAQTAN